MWEPSILQVVTHRNWVAQELAQSKLEVKQSHGLSLPKDIKSSAWWMPTEYAARFLASGADLKLAAPRPDLLSLLPQEHLGRKVVTSTLENAAFEGPGWAKPADIKVDTLPAKFYLDSKDFIKQASTLLPADSLVHFTSTTLEIKAEFRFYVSNDEVLTGSLYLSEGVSYYEDVTFDGGFKECRTLAQEVASFLKDNSLNPKGYVLDVALTPPGPVVLEFNPAWSSAFYGSDIDAVVDTLVSASDPSSSNRWTPDPYLQMRAQRMRPLPIDA